jgi:HD-like signal output (HDOD) protein/CheY-like chemotaxis protein
MVNDTYRALVVDDEASLRNLTIRALQREGFSCDAAGDGLEAEKLIPFQRYDVLVTDLKMPNMNGHALASEVLLMDDRPLVVVLTGILEPRLTKDLTVRGVDCIEFKPVNPQLFAAKIRALVDRRRRQRDVAQQGTASPLSPTSEGHSSYEDDVRQGVTMIRKQDLHAKLTQLSRILPISKAAMEVYNLTNMEACEISQIAAATARDPSLSLDILKLANSSYYNFTRKKIVALDEAILRIGQKRVGELALATSAMTMMTATLLPWINTDLIWRRSVAAGIATDRLVSHKGIPNAENQIFLSAILHPLGRVALGMLYPDKYLEMIRRCRECRTTIEEQERFYFPATPEDVLGDLMKSWNIPEGISEPLKYSSHPYSSLSTLADPLGFQAQLLKIAILIGQIAVGEWEPWDRIELPPDQALNRLGVESYAEILVKTRIHTEEIIRLREEPSSPQKNNKTPARSQPSSSPVPYYNLSSGSFDFLREILARSGNALAEGDLDAILPEEGMIVNCLGCPAHRLVSRLNLSHYNSKMLILTTPSQSENYRRFGQVLALPTDFWTLQEACEKVAGTAETLTTVS